MRQQVDQQFGYPFHELHRLRERPDVTGHARMKSVQWLEFRDVIRVWQEPHIENQVAVGRNAVAKAEAVHVDENLLRLPATVEALHDQRSQIVNIQFRSV